MIAQISYVTEIWWQWMSSMFWQASLLVLLVTLVDMAIRRWAWPQVRYVLWGLVFLKLIIPPAWQMPTSIVSWLQAGFESQVSVRIETEDMDSEAKPPPFAVPPVRSRNPETSEKGFPVWQAGIFLGWFAGLLAFGLTLLIRMARLRKQQLTQKNRRIPEWFSKLLTQTARDMRLKHIPAVVFSEKATGPAVFGLLRPALLLPEGYLEKLPEQQAAHVLLHELCHLKRGDLVLHWFSLVLQVIYWFNPLLFWARRQMRHVCEICCDLSVANILRERTHDYRNTILNNARELLSENAKTSLGLLGIFEDPFRLVSRLKWLEKRSWEHRKRKITATVLSSLVMVFCVMPMSGLSRSADQGETLSLNEGDTSGGSDRMTSRVKLDADRPLLYIEALIVEVDKPVGYTARSMTFFEADSQNLENSYATIISTVNGERKAKNGFSVLSNGEITINEKSFSDIETGIKKLSNTPGVTILTTPRLLTLPNNEKCSIQIGRSDKSEAHHPGAAVPEEPGFLLEITSRLLEDGGIHQHLFVELGRETDKGITSGAMEGDIQFWEDDILVFEMPNEDIGLQGKIVIFMKTIILESQEEVDLTIKNMEAGS
jgi:beta-lactamase regulating signal transducer with metallopeptidase domain